MSVAGWLRAGARWMVLVGVGACGPSTSDPDEVQGGTGGSSGADETGGDDDPRIPVTDLDPPPGITCQLAPLDLAAACDGAACAQASAAKLSCPGLEDAYVQPLTGSGVDYVQSSGEHTYLMAMPVQVDEPTPTDSVAGWDGALKIALAVRPDGGVGGIASYGSQCEVPPVLLEDALAPLSEAVPLTLPSPPCVTRVAYDAEDRMHLLYARPEHEEVAVREAGDRWTASQLSADKAWWWFGDTRLVGLSTLDEGEDSSQLYAEVDDEVVPLGSAVADADYPDYAVVDIDAALDTYAALVAGADGLLVATSDGASLPIAGTPQHDPSGVCPDADYSDPCSGTCSDRQTALALGPLAGDAFAGARTADGTWWVAYILVDYDIDYEYEYDDGSGSEGNPHCFTTALEDRTTYSLHVDRIGPDGTLEPMLTRSMGGLDADHWEWVKMHLDGERLVVWGRPEGWVERIEIDTAAL